MLKVHESFKEPEERIKKQKIEYEMAEREPEQKPSVSEGKKKADASVVQTSNGSSSL